MKDHFKKIIFALVVLIFFILFFVFRLYSYFSIQNLSVVKEWILQFGPLGLIILTLLYLLFNLMILPTFFFNLLSGYLYGPVSGFMVAWIGMMGGLIASFFNSRYLFRNDFQKRFGSHQMMKTLEDHTLKYKGLSVLLFRVIFIIPYNLQNIFYGLTSIRVSSYIWGSAVGIIPMTLLHVILGNLLNMNRITRESVPLVMTVASVIIIVFLIFMIGISRLRKKVLVK